MTTSVGMIRSALDTREVGGETLQGNGVYKKSVFGHRLTDQDRKEITNIVRVKGKQDNTLMNKGSGLASVNKLAGDFQMFLKILTTSLKYQDPSKPKDLDSLVQNITAFANIEQALATNAKLDKLVDANNFKSLDHLVGYIDQDIVGKGNILNMEDPMEGISYYYDVPEQADPQTLAIAIHDENGDRVFFKKLEGEELSPGRHGVYWDGKTNAGGQVPPGLYRVVVHASDAQKKTLEAPTYIIGHVKGIEKDNDGQVHFTFGTISMPVDNMVSVLAPLPKKTPFQNTESKTLEDQKHSHQKEQSVETHQLSQGISEQTISNSSGEEMENFSLRNLFEPEAEIQPLNHPTILSENLGNLVQEESGPVSSSARGSAWPSESFDK